MSKSFSEFRPSAKYADGFGSWCRGCHAEASRAHYLANKAVRNAAARAWTLSNPEKVRAANVAHQRRNKGTLAEKHRKWVVENRHARRAIDARRKAQKRQATPAWANERAIRDLYAVAVRIQDVTGVRMHVDHIVPLRSHLVCGLHCEENLQILPGADNEAKKNYWWPDMPGIEQAQAQGKLFEPEQPTFEQLSLK